jgi:hypothetical protein
MMFPRKFRPVCQYVMRDKKLQDFKVLDEKLWQQSGVVYARTYRNKVVYIGSTNRTLSKRIDQHRRLASHSRLVERYRKWAEGKKIIILAYKPAPIKLLGLETSVHRGIETALISKFGRPGEPDWFNQ